MDKSFVNKGKKLIEELVSILKQSTDNHVLEMLGHGLLDQLLRAILDPDANKQPNLQEFLLVNKGRATLIALLHHLITQNYSFKGILKNGRSSFISPSCIQWFDEGVMFLQSNERFKGLLGLYRKDKTLSYAIAARDVQVGEQLGPEHFKFIDEDECNQLLEQLHESQTANLDKPIQQLEFLLNSKDNDESKYQELLIKHPWVFGAKYKKIHRHSKLDDKNIPDFTGIRVKDGCRDIFEIKPPFAKFFCNDGTFSNEFHKVWNQAERYLDFTRQETDYLRKRKGFRFENPKCYVILGFNLSVDEINQIHAKERMNPAIELLTYNDLLVQMKGTKDFVLNLKDNKLGVGM